MTRLLLLLMALPAALLAATENALQTGEFPVYVWGDVGAMKFAFNAVAMMVQDEDLIEPFKILAGMLGALYISGFLVGQDLKKAALGTGWLIGTLTLLLGTNGQVHIVDKRAMAQPIADASYGTVDNVPYVLSFATGISSSFTESLITPIDVASAPIVDNTMNYGNIGFMGQFKMLSDMITLSGHLAADGDQSKAYSVLNNYFTRCVMEHVLDIGPERMALLTNPTKSIKDLTPAMLGVENEMYAGTQTCQQYYNVGDVNFADAFGVQAAFTAVSTSLFNKLKTMHSSININAASPEMLKYMADVDNSLGAANVQDAMLNIAVSTSVLPNAADNVGTGVSGIDNANAVSAADSKNRLLSGGTGQFAWMADMLPKAMHILFAIMIIAYIPMAIVVSIVGMMRGAKILMNFVFGMIAFYFAHVALALVQNVVNYYAMQGAADMFLALGSNPLTVNNIPYYIQYLTEMTGVAGVIGAVAVPFVIGIVFKGETAAAGAIAGSIKGAYADGGLEGARDKYGHDAENQQLKNRNAENMAKTAEDIRAGRILDDMGVSFRSGEAQRVLADMESGISAVNNIGARSDAISSDHGYERLDAAYNAQSTKSANETLGYGQVVVEGGGLDAIHSIGEGARVSGAKAAGADIAFGESARSNDIDNGKDDALHAGAGVGSTEGLKQFGSIRESADEAHRLGITNESGQVVGMKERMAGINTAKAAGQAISRAEEEVRNDRNKLAGDRKDLSRLKDEGEELEDRLQDAQERAEKGEGTPYEVDRLKASVERNKAAVKAKKAEVAKDEENLDASNKKLERARSEAAEASQDLSNNLMPSSVRNLMKGAGVDAAAELASATKKGEEINKKPNGTEDYIRAAELDTVSSTATQMTKGQRGKEADFRAQGNKKGLDAVGDAQSAMGSSETRMFDETGNIADEFTEEMARDRLSSVKSRRDKAKTMLDATDINSDKWESAKKALDSAEKEVSGAESDLSRIMNGEKVSNPNVGNYVTGVAAKGASAMATTIGTGSEVSRTPEGFNEFVRGATLDAVSSTASQITKGANGSESDFRAQGNQEGLKSVASARGVGMTQIFDDQGDVKYSVGAEDIDNSLSENKKKQKKMQKAMDDEEFGRDGKTAGKGKAWEAAKKELDSLKAEESSLQAMRAEIAKNGSIPNSELVGFMRGTERSAREGTNQTIGAGKADLGETDNQYMADIQKTSARDIMEKGVKGKAAGKAMNVSHDERGFIDEMSLTDEYKTGVKRGAEGQIEATKAKSQVRDDKGDKITDDEYAQNVKSGAIDNETKSQMNAKALREKFGDNLDGTYGGKTLTQTEKDRVAELEDSNKQLADKKKSLQKMTESGFVTGEGKNGAASVPASPAQLKEAKDEIAKLSTQMDSNNAELSKIGTDRAPMTAAEMHKVQAGAAIDGSIGKSQGIKDAMDKSKGGNADIYRQNAQYGELSNQLKTDAKIQAQGGVEKAANIDASESAIKSKEQMGALDGKVQELAKSGGVSAEEADKLGKKVAEGGATAAELMKAGILSSAQALASAQSGGKTAGDLAKLEEYNKNGDGGVDRFIASQKRQAIDAEAPKEAMLDFTDDKKRLSRKINDMKDEALDRGQFIQDAIREDMIEHDGKGNAKVDSDGNLIAKTGDNWVRGMAHLAAVSQEKSERIFMGGTGMNMRTDIGTGETLVDTNSGEASTRGHQLKQDYEMMAAMGVTGGDLEEAQKIVTTGGLTDHLSSKKAVASFVGNVGRGTANGIVEGLHATGAISDERYEQTKEWINESDSAGFVAVAAPGAVVTAELISRKPVELPQSRLDNLDPQKAGFYAQDGKTRVANADGYRLDEKGRPTQELMPEEELSKLKSQHEGYYKDGKMVANKEKKQVNAKGDEVKRGVISKSMGGSYRGLGRGKDALLDKFSPGTLATKQETGDASSDYQDAKDGKGSENSKSDKLHNNPPKNFIDKDILASIKDDVNPLQAKESLKGVSNENLAKQTLAERLHAKRIETMESGVLSPEEKSARLAKITSAENALGAENPRLNKTALVGNPKNPGIFSPKEFEQMGLSTGENGNTVDLEGSGENIRATKNDALTKAAAAAEASKPSEAPKAEPKAPSAAQQASQKVQLNEIAKQKASLDTDTPQGEADSKRLSQMEDYVKENGSLKGYAESNNVPQSTMKKYGLDNKSLDAIDKRTEVNYDKAELNKRPDPKREPTSSVKTDEAADAVKASDAPEVHGTTPDVPESKTGKVVGGLVTGAKELSKGAVIGAVIDVGANAASQTALDNGHFKTAAAAAYIGDIMSGAGNVIAGGVVGAAGAIDQGANALFGMKPIGSASKAIGLTDHDDMLKSANSFLSDAYDDALTATQNRHNLTEGNNQVSGMKAGEKTKAEKIYDWGKDVVGDEEPTKDESASLAGGGNTEQPKTKKMVTDSPAANDVLEADATIQSKSSADVGKEAVASLVNRAPESEARSNLIESMVNGGSATTQDLESIGVPKATVDQLPVNTDGTINEEALGDTIKGESAAIAKEMQQIVKRNTVIEEGEVTDNTAPLSIDTGDGTAATITDQVSAPAEVPISAKEAARAAEQNEAIQSLPSEVVGARTVQAFMDQAQTLAPQSFEQQQAVTQAMASGEPVIPSQLVSAGIPQQVVDAMPLTANGAVDVQGVGQQTQQMMQDATATQMNQAQQSEALSEYQQTQQGASSLDALSNLNDAVRQSQNVRTIDLPMLDGSTITGEVSQRADGAEISAQAEGRRDLYYANKSSNKTALESASASYMQLEDIREAILSQNAVEDEGGSAVDENSF